MSDLTRLNPTRCVRFATTVASGHATLATKQDATLYLGRTFTGWIAPALPGALNLITSPRHLEHRGNDAGITGAAAQVAAEHVHHFGFRWVGIAHEKIGERHQDTRRAEAALQRVIVLERLLQRVERAVRTGKRFHRRDPPSFRLHRKREAGTGGDAVDEHRAAAAHAVLAAHVGAGRTEHVAQKIAQQHARLHLAPYLAAVERERQPRALPFVHAAHRIASCTTSGASRRSTSRRMRADAWRSS